MSIRADAGGGASDSSGQVGIFELFTTTMCNLKFLFAMFNFFYKHPKFFSRGIDLVWEPLWAASAGPTRLRRWPK